MPVPELARERLKRIFRFLQALDQHRNPAKRRIDEQLWKLWLNRLPEHETIVFEYPIDIPEAVLDEPGVTREGGDSSGDENGSSVVLRVRRPQLTKCPEPPAEHLDWISGNWQDPSSKVELLQVLETEGEDAESLFEDSRVARLEDDPPRVRALRQWIDRRQRWADVEINARKAMAVFQQLYGLHGTIAREGEQVELMLGDGILNWRQPGGGVHHPVLLQRVELHFDPAVPQFEVVEGDSPVELYTSPLRSSGDVEGLKLAELRRELEAGGFYPLHGDSTSAFLKGLVNRLADGGEFVEDGAPRGEMDHPRIGRDPVLFLRRRVLGFAQAIEAVLEDLDECEDVPEPLIQVAGIDNGRNGTEEPVVDDATVRQGLEPEDILLSKLANPEQIRVAQRLQGQNSVVVQGPPGTGKTHTIANLIGHLLAQGKSILVTAHTAKALAVLRDQVVEPLQPLCVSVLGNDTESRKQMAASVEQIVERLSSSDEEDLKRRAAGHQKRRRELLEEMAQLKKGLVTCRASEFTPIVLAGRSFEPSAAARRVSAEAGLNGWIPGPIDREAPLPLSDEEVRRLYDLNSLITGDDEREIQNGLPDLADLTTPIEFEEFAAGSQSMAELDISTGSEFWEKDIRTDDAEELSVLLDEVNDVAASLRELPSWGRSLVESGCRGGAHEQTWRHLLRDIDQFCAAALRAQEFIFRYGPSLPEGEFDAHLRVISEIIKHLEARKRLSRVTLLLHPEWKELVRGAKTAGKKPRHLDQFRALRELAQLQIQKDKLCGRWSRQTAGLGLPPADELDDISGIKFEEIARLMRSALEWSRNQWDPAREKVEAGGFNVVRISNSSRHLGSQTPQVDELEILVRNRLPAILQARINAAKRLHFLELRRSLELKVFEYTGPAAPSQTVGKLIRSIKALDVAGYASAHEALARLSSLKPPHQERIGLIEKLHKLAPDWARRLARREGPHAEAKPPGNAAGAWTWLQLKQELERRQELSLDEIQQKIERTGREIRRETAALIENRAWAAQKQRTGLTQQQALFGWRDIVARTPKTSTVPGKLARLKREAREALRKCRDAVPVWIMPMSRLVDSFEFRQTAQSRFDVAIIDEASQTDVMGLLVYYLAHKVLVVGDHEQVSPAAVGQKDEVVMNLIDEHLEGIPNAIVYDGKTSIYDLARQSSRGMTCLLEHFRCVPEIIQFSNHLCYQGRIKPLRDPGSVVLQPAVVQYQVRGSRDQNKVNRIEAEAVASLMAACLERPEYRESSFGVISLVGDRQALEIDRLLRQYLRPKDYEAHRIVAGNAAHFQGDERDVMFLSMVDAVEGGPAAFRDQPIFRQRFNVAASRAKDQLWVVHSLDPQRDLQPGDLRRRLIEHALDPGALVRRLDRAEDRAESEFERQVLQRLVRAGYRVRSQWQVGYYRIDIVVEGGGKRLAVECDGDRYHTIDDLQADMERQATLERLGWNFVRIRGTHFFKDPDDAMQAVFNALERQGVTREAEVEETTGHRPSDLVEAVIRRADEIRRAWNGDEEVDIGDDSEGSDAQQPGRDGEPIKEDAGEPSGNSYGSSDPAHGEESSAPAPPTTAGVGRPSREAVAEAVMVHVPEIGRILESQLVRKVAAALGFTVADADLKALINEAVAKLVNDGALEKDRDDVWRRSWRVRGLG